MFIDCCLYFLIPSWLSIVHHIFHVVWLWHIHVKTLSSGYQSIAFYSCIIVVRRLVGVINNLIHTTRTLWEISMFDCFQGKLNSASHVNRYYKADINTIIFINFQHFKNFQNIDYFQEYMNLSKKPKYSQTFSFNRICIIVYVT